MRQGEWEKGSAGWNRGRRVQAIKKRYVLLVGEAGSVGIIPPTLLAPSPFPPSPFLLSSRSLSLLSVPVCICLFPPFFAFSPQEMNWPLTCLLSRPSLPHQPPNWGQLCTASVPDRQCSHSVLAILACYLLFTCQFPTVCLPVPPAQHKPPLESSKLPFFSFFNPVDVSVDLQFQTER